MKESDSDVSDIYKKKVELGYYPVIWADRIARFYI